jgi:cell division protein FtsI (penicillin-binding protein 3)
MHAPRYVVMAMLDEPKGIGETFGYATGGWTAAPVISRVIARAAPLLGVRPVDELAPVIQQALALKPAATLEFRRQGVASN